MITEYEKGTILPMVKKILEHRSSDTEHIQPKKILDFINKRLGIELTDRRLKLIVGYITSNGLLPVVYEKTGYHMTKDIDKLRTIIERQELRAWNLIRGCILLEDWIEEIEMHLPGTYDFKFDKQYTIHDLDRENIIKW